MLGASTPLRDIPERVGYDRIFLECKLAIPINLSRACRQRGNFRCYDGLHLSVPEDQEPKTLAAKHNPTREDNLSTFLLGKINLTGKKIRRNASGDKNNLTFRYLAHLSLISEGDIQKREFPIKSGQFTARSLELSVFKLLLTGVDDSAIQSVQRDDAEDKSRIAAEIIDELIAEHRTRLAELVGEEDDLAELNSQLEKLDQTLTRERFALRQTEQAHREILQRRTELRKRSEVAKDRREEIDELIARFNLLNRHYQSDLAQLDGVREAGTLFSALGRKNCPLCGAAPEAQRHNSDCDGNVDVVVAAADAEAEKIKLLRRELADAIVSYEMKVHDVPG